MLATAPKSKMAPRVRNRSTMEKVLIDDVAWRTTLSAK
jgi:hypothetical protein